MLLSHSWTVDVVMNHHWLCGIYVFGAINRSNYLKAQHFLNFESYIFSLQPKTLWANNLKVYKEKYSNGQILVGYNLFAFKLPCKIRPWLLRWSISKAKQISYFFWFNYYERIILAFSINKTHHPCIDVCVITEYHFHNYLFE